MSENSKTPDPTITPEDAPPRRLFIFRAAAVLSGAVIAAVGASSRSAKAQTDSDPNDPAGGGRGASKGNTDSDPTDVVGYGKGTKTTKGPTPTGGQTDSDPSDRAGQGKGNGPKGKWCTDSDPSDKAGKGRNC